MSAKVHAWCMIQPPHLLTISRLVRIPAPATTQRSQGIECACSSKSSDFSVDYDPFEDFFGLGIDMKTRKQRQSVDESQSSYKKHVPCPVCRGRGYVLDSPKGPSSCSYCVGKGMVLEDSIWESAWDTSQIRSPLVVEDDETLDKIDPDVPERRPEKRVYGPRPEAVRRKISRTMKELERRTGALSKRAKRQHQNPIIHSRMAAAIKEAKNTEAAKLKVSQNQKRFFQDPENRRMRGLQMKGVKFSCKHCGKEGHRRHYCPELGYVARPAPVRVYQCGNCRQAGHTRRQCPHPPKEVVVVRGPRTYKPRAKGVTRGPYKCSHCQATGHSRRTCPELAE